MSSPIPLPPAGGDVDIGYKLEIGATVTFTLALGTVLLRTYARTKYTRLGLDDYFILFAIVQAFLATIFDYVAVGYGLGKHSYYLNINEPEKAIFYELLAQVFCIDALTCCKISICISYLRILNRVNAVWLRFVLYLTMILVLVINTTVIVSFYTLCTPVKKNWDPSLPGACWRIPAETSLILLQASFSALTDLSLSLTPIFLLKDLQVDKRSKLVLYVLMGLGVVTAIFAIIRVSEVSKDFGMQTDSSYTKLLPLLWSGMERNIAIMVASVPSLRPLVGPIMQYTSRRLTRLSGRSISLQSNQNTRLSSSKNMASAGVVRSTSVVKNPAGRSASEEYILPEC